MTLSSPRFALVLALVLALVPAGYVLANSMPPPLRSRDNLSLLSKRGLIKGSVELSQSDLLNVFIEQEIEQSRPILIVSNPPYISSQELPQLMLEVSQHEPHLALIGGGDDGLDVVRRLVAQASKVLSPQGAIIMEVGWNQTKKTQALLLQAGFTHTWTRKDYGGHLRVVGGTLS